MVKVILAGFLLAFFLAACSSTRGPAPFSCLTNEGAFLQYDITLDRNYFVVFSDFQVTSGRLSEASPGREDVLVRILGRDGSVLSSHGYSLDFILFSDPPHEIEQDIVFDEIRYDCHMATLQVLRGDHVVFSEDLMHLCVRNGVCGEGENYLSCVEDCRPWASDGVCNSDEDGNCDADCMAGIDPDCQTGQLA
ncbi:MAG: hypothetical protein V1735_00460 [Nanoarchaeota archaeon]